MTKTFEADVAGWVAESVAVLDATVSDAVGGMLADIEVVPGINRGGARVRGTIPRDLGALARSLQSTLYGSTALDQSGEASHVLIVGAMKAGDTAQFSWGGAVAPYAEHVHYGANGVPGTFWIDVAAGKWQGYVDAAVAKAKAELA